jgi:hypothetical protein
MANQIVTPLISPYIRLYRVQQVEQSHRRIGFRIANGNRSEPGTACTAMDTIPASSADPTSVGVLHVPTRSDMAWAANEQCVGEFALLARSKMRA